MIFPGFPGVLSFFQVFQVFQVEWEPWENPYIVPHLYTKTKQVYIFTQLSTYFLGHEFKFGF